MSVSCNLGVPGAAPVFRVGLGNLRERLLTLRGPQARLTLAAAAGGGSLATIEWPLR